MPPDPADGARPPLPWWVTLIVAALVVGFLAIAVISQWSNVSTAELRFEPLWLLASIPPLLVFQITHGELALSVLRRLGYPVPPVRGRSIVGAALLARYVPTGALVFAVRIALNEREGVPKRISTVAMVYELALGLAGAAVAAVPLLPHLGTVLLIAGVLPLAGIAVLHPAPFARVTAVLLRRAGVEPLSQVLPFRTVVVFVIGFALSFWLAGLSLLCVLLSITPVQAGDVVAVVSSYALGFLTSMVGFALPGGLGAREAGLVAGLSATVAAPVALAAVAIARLVQTAVELAYAGGATLHDRLKSRRTTSLTPSGR